MDKIEKVTFLNEVQCQPEVVKVSNVLSNKIHKIEANISEIVLKLDRLSEDIKSHHENLSNGIFTSFENFQHGIDSIQANLNVLKSNFGDLEAKISSEVKASTISSHSQSSAKFQRAVKAIRFIGRTRKKVIRGSRTIFVPYEVLDLDEIKRIPKSNEEKIFIKDVIKNSTFYQHSICSEDELKDLVDAMYLDKFEANSIIAAQGSDLQKSDISIVRTGTVDVYKDGILLSTRKSKQMLIAFYMVGVGTVNSYEFRAKTDCELYCISASLFHQIITYYSRTSQTQKASFLRSVSFLSIFIVTNSYMQFFR